jgi:Domain of unknown function (DUF222)/HNH endonuclease
MVLDALTADVDALVGLDPEALADEESLVALHRQLNRLQAVVTRATGRFETSEAWQLDGSRTAAGWLMRHCRMAKPTAKADVHLARSLRHLPACQEAWLAGDISRAHVRILAGARRPGLEEVMERDEATLVGHAKHLQFRHFSKTVEYWLQLADADRADRDAQRRYDDRRVHLSQGYGGTWLLDGELDPIGGGVIAGELARLEDQLFTTEWADAKSRLGHDPTAADLERSPRQRRADALLEMATRSASAPADARRPEPLFTILVGWETFSGRICELANGTVIAPGSLVPWLASAWLERIVFDSPSRVTDVGVARRLFKGATRRAVEVRDRECFHPACDVTAERCQVDHIIPHSAGGPTTIENGRLACGYHNRERHKPPP